MSYTVTVVLDRNYGERLTELPNGRPIWIVDTPENRAVARRIWAERPDESHLTGVTTFKFNEHLSAEEILIGEFETIDLHHGSFSADPPYTVVNVIDAQLTDGIKGALSEYGFNEFHVTGAGFLAVRPHFTIHIGDVYYVGDPPEINENCLGIPNPSNNYAPVKWPIGSRGSFALNGNHEMYANGGGYFDVLLPKLGRTEDADRSSHVTFFVLNSKLERFTELGRTEIRVQWGIPTPTEGFQKHPRTRPFDNAYLG